MTTATFHRAWLAQTLVCALLAAAPALAQTQDDLFNDTAVQEIQLTVSSRDWEALKARADENTYYAADLRWRGVTVRNVGIRSRGTGSRNGVKPGLRIDMNRYVDQDFLGLRALVLDNAYTDPSSLREVLSMKLFARAGLPAPREVHARLFVNNEYAGLYIAVEPIDRMFVTRVFGDAEGNVENGGFLYEYTWVREYGFEYLGPALEPYAEIFEPRTRETDAVSRLYQPLETLTRAVNDTPPDRLDQAVGALLDLPAFVRFLAVQQVAAEIDGFVGNWGMSNFYLYRFRDGRPAQVLPWDADHAFWAAGHAHRLSPRDQRAHAQHHGRPGPAPPVSRDPHRRLRSGRRRGRRRRPRLARTGGGPAGRRHRARRRRRSGHAVHVRGIRRQRPGPPGPAPHPPLVCRLRRARRPRPSRAAILPRTCAGRHPRANARALNGGGVRVFEHS